ncbi:hypothetical protein WI81_24390 [Burkholderia ubonensis]|uniref:hypothetical protein n=1 Tax=Burkholderia ubonensis TaxID=101571 RepID=UPI00075DE1E4|nr:hypothetical protein [Burkholderia ubonensis]KVD11634.1 hypothetical protein WI81_24390 [Burkholderia ubonensis]
MTTESKKSPTPEQASEAVPQRPRTENPTAEAIFEQAAGAGNLISSKFGFGDGNNRADALTADQRQALGQAISEYFGRLDSDVGVRAPEGRVLRAFDYCDSRNIDDLIDRAVVPALAASPVEQPAAAPADERAAFIEAYVLTLPQENREVDPDAARRFAESVITACGPSWQLWQAGIAYARAAASPAAEDDNSITLDRRDLFDFVRGAIKSTLQDYKAGEGMTPSWYWQEATNRTEAVLEALDTTSPYIEAAPQPAQAEAPADAREPITRESALAAIDEFELVCDNNDARNLTDDEKFAVSEFVISLFENAPLIASASERRPITYIGTQATNCASCGEHKHTPLRIDWMGGYVCLTCIDRELESRAPADAGEPIGQHDVSTSTGDRAYIAEFFAKRLRRHDFGGYIAERLAADFACALAQYLSEHDAASRAEPCVELPRFPTMLRKMWSGGEVQRWIDENIAPHVLLTPATISTAALATNSRSHDDR